MSIFLTSICCQNLCQALSCLTYTIYPDLPLFWILYGFSWSSVPFVSVSDVDSSFSNGNTTTGAAGTMSQRSFKNFLNLLTISILNSSSWVKRSKRRKARTYLKGTTNRMVAEEKSTSATSEVIWKEFK